MSKGEGKRIVIDSKHKLMLIRKHEAERAANDEAAMDFFMKVRGKGLQIAPMRESLPLTYYESNCFLNAYINMRHHYKELGLRMKVGSLGMNGFFEYGGKDWTLARFAASQVGSYTFDAHAWLEDKDGKIYDFVFDWYNSCAIINTGKPLGITGIIEGKTKAELEAVGLSYVEAPMDAVCYMIKSGAPWIKFCEESLLAGLSVFVSTGQQARLVGIKFQG